MLSDLGLFQDEGVVNEDILQNILVKSEIHTAILHLQHIH